MLELLLRNPLFLGLNLNTIQELMRKLDYNILEFNDGEYIRFRGDKHDHMHLILSGKVKTEMLKSSGESYEIEVITAPAILAPAFLFNDKNIFPVNVFSDGPSKLMIIRTKELLSLLQENEIILKNYLKLFSNKAFFLSQKIWFNFYNKTIKQKLSAYILENQKNNTFYLNTSIENLSDFFGVTRPSLSRCIKELIDNNTLERKSKKEFLIKNLNYLEECLT